MSTSYLETRFNDGEGLILSDLHDMQRFLKAQVFDQGFGAQPRLAIADPGFPTSTLNSFVLTPHAGGCYHGISRGGGNIGNDPGYIYQWVATGAPAGQVCNLLGYQVGTDELQCAPPLNPAGSDRYDLLCVQLAYSDTYNSQTRDFKDASTGALSSQPFYKNRRTTCAVSYVQGTAGAGLPAVPAGYAIHAIFRAPASNGAIETWDERLPMRLKYIRTFARNAIYGSGWTLSSDGFSLKNTAAASRTMYFPAPFYLDARLIQVAMYGTTGTGSSATATLKKFSTNSATLSASAISTGANLSQSMGASAFGAITPSKPPGALGPPVWGGGIMSYSQSSSFGFNIPGLALEIVDNGAGTPADWTVVDWLVAY